MKNLEAVAGVYFCAGARNQELLDCFGEHTLRMEIDERSASFKALGLAKATNSPAIICTTSGTAVSECLSAMVEAYYSETKLILLSADRPLKLQNSGAPQTINHKVITTGHVKQFVDLELSELSSLDLLSLNYPAHINVRVTKKDEAGQDNFQSRYSDFPSFMAAHKKPLFLFSHAPVSLRPLVEKFLAYDLPFYAEVVSGCKDLGPIKTEKKLLQLFHAGAFDCVVRIGHTPLSKLWRLLEGQKLPVYNFDSRGLLGLSYGEIETLSPQELMETKSFWDALPKAHKLHEDKTQEQLQSLMKRYPRSEPSLVRELHDSLPTNAKVYLGNSLPIRYFEMIQTKPFEIMANRGANGIDGQLSTAIGWATSTKETVYCFIGDMTCFYDLSCLSSLPANLKCIIMNNGGGRIFDHLGMDLRLTMAHSHDLEDICRGFKLSYSNELKDLARTQVIELKPDLEESHNLIKEWKE